MQEAKQEALEEVARLGALKKEGKLGKSIVTGCMTQRYREELETLCPDADGFVGSNGYEDIAKVIAAVSEGERPYHFGDVDAPVPETDRVVATSDHWAYLRIAEGCDNRCSYCMIPSIRGKFRSRPEEAILEEAQSLADCGMREIIIVAQDITRYGLDLYGERRLTALLEKLCAIEGIVWIRLHYLYPDEIDQKLMELVAKEPKIVNYLDLPLQHISSSVLKAMNRRGDGADLRGLLLTLRGMIPNLVLRTSLICGFPGETEADFEELCTFLRDFRIERAGIFAYSPEEGSAAARMEDQVEEDVKRRRLELLTQIQLEVTEEYAQNKVGKTGLVLCEGFDFDTERFYGRSEGESPDIDGRVYFEETEEDPEVGLFYPVTFISVEDGELICRREGAGQ